MSKTKTKFAVHPLRGVLAYIFVGLMAALPGFLKLVHPFYEKAEYSNQLLRLSLICLGAGCEFIGGLSIAFGSRWMKKEFWVSTNLGMLSELKKRLWTYIPWVFLGVFAGLSSSQFLSPGVFSLDWFFEIFLRPASELLILVLAMGILRRFLSFRSALVCIAIVGVVLRLVPMKWSDTDLILKNVVLLLNAGLYPAVLLWMLENTKGSVAFVLCYMVLQAAFRNLFYGFQGGPGPVINNLFELASVAAIFWYEARRDARPDSSGEQSA